jgi:hypothetical protein
MLHRLRSQNAQLGTTNRRHKPAVKAERRPGDPRSHLVIPEPGEPEVRTSKPEMRSTRRHPALRGPRPPPFIARMKLNPLRPGPALVPGQPRRRATPRSSVSGLLGRCLCRTLPADVACGTGRPWTCPTDERRRGMDALKSIFAAGHAAQHLVPFALVAAGGLALARLQFRLSPRAGASRQRHRRGLRHRLSATMLLCASTRHNSSFSSFPDAAPRRRPGSSSRPSATPTSP